MEDNKFRSIGFNLINKHVKNKKISKVIENSIYNYTINKSKYYNYSLSFDDILIIKRNKEKKKLEESRSMGLVTDIYKCGRKKKKKCTYYKMQTRSCDEPMTTFITCLNCNNSWSF